MRPTAVLLPRAYPINSCFFGIRPRSGVERVISCDRSMPRPEFKHPRPALNEARFRPPFHHHLRLRPEGHPHETDQTSLASSAGTISARLPFEQQWGPRRRAAGARLGWTGRRRKQGRRRDGDEHARPRGVRHRRSPRSLPERRTAHRTGSPPLGERRTANHPASRICLQGHRRLSPVPAFV